MRDGHGQWKTGEGGIPRSFGIQRGELTCEEALAVSDETSGSLLVRDLQLYQLVGGPCSLRIRA